MRVALSRPMRMAPPPPVVVWAALAAPAFADEHLWTSRGPADVAWVTDAAIADGTAYAGTLNGVFRSVDGASTWQSSGLQGPVDQPGGRAFGGERRVRPRERRLQRRPAISTRRGTAERRGRPSCPT